MARFLSLRVGSSRGTNKLEVLSSKCKVKASDDLPATDCVPGQGDARHRR